MDKTRYIVAGSFIDGSGAEVSRNVFLKVKDGIITNIGQAAELPKNDDAAVDDLSHCTIVPPLVDCSVFLSRSPSVDEKVRLNADAASLLKQHIRYCHSHGVLGLAESDESIVLENHIQELRVLKSIIDIRTSGSDFLRIIYSDSIDNGKTPGSDLTPEDLNRILQQKGKKRRWSWPMGSSLWRRHWQPGAMP